MADLTNTLYSFDEDGILRLQKDLNFMLSHLDERNVKRLYTEYCEIKSENGETEIDGPLLNMYDSSHTLRLKMGYDKLTSKFGFNLYNSLGAVSITLDSIGDAVFSGSVNTIKDAYIGEHLYMGTSSTPYSMTTNTRGMFIIKPGTTEYLGHFYSTNPGGAGWELEIESSEVFNITAASLMRIYQYAGYTQTMSTASVNSTDYLEIHSFNNRAFIQTAGHISTHRGTFLGNTFKEAYLAAWADSSSRIATDGYIKPKNLENDAWYFIGKNTKRISYPTTSIFISASTACNVSASTYGIASPGIRNKNIVATTDVFIESQGTFTAIDLTTFHDGSIATSDDYLVAGFYVESTAAIKASHGVYVFIGGSSANYYRYLYHSTFGYPISTGYNLIARKLGSYASAVGTPSFSAISYAAFGWRALMASSGIGVTYDYLALHRADQTSSAFTLPFNDFQKVIGSTYTNEYWQYQGKHMLTHWNSTEWQILNVGTSPSQYELRMESRQYDNFNIDLSFQVRSVGFSPEFTWWYDTSNEVNVWATTSVLYVDVKYNSTIDRYTANLPTLSYGDNVKWNISKTADGIVQVVHQQNSNVNNLRNVRCTSPFKLLHHGYIYLGSQVGPKYYLLTGYKANREY